MPEDPLETVRQAERLVREATERAERIAGETPSRGFEEPREQQAAPPFPDLQRQLQQALRELLIALRAVLDYSIDRLEPGPEPPSATVEDIPIS